MFPKNKTTSVTLLPAARNFFEQLAAQDVRFGVFKSTETTPDGVAGLQDMDIIVARDNYSAFCRVAAAVGGIRGVTHTSLTSLGREDWFLPDVDNARYLHLDVHTQIRLGGKFNKHYPAFEYTDIARWEHYEIDGLSFPIASPADEAAITLSRVAFRHVGPLWPGKWVTLSGDWARELKTLVFPGTETEKSVAVGALTESLNVRCRLVDGHLQVRNADLRAVRRFVRLTAGEPRLSILHHAFLNRYRQARYFAARIWTRVLAGTVLDRRRPASGGLVVALIAPDGLGKSSQVERLYRVFKWKFCVSKVYLGIGDGEGWLVRKLIVRIYKRQRDRLRLAMELDAPSPTSKLSDSPRAPSFRRRLGATALSIHGWIAARERYTKLRRVRRMANRGYIVFTDRWPQDLQHGYMDGPVRLSEEHLFPFLKFIRRHELAMFEQMRNFVPDISIHMVADYSVSAQRKPGEISEEAFRTRIALMDRMREGASHCSVVDAAQPMDKVTSNLFAQIWRIL